MWRQGAGEKGEVYINSSKNGEGRYGGSDERISELFKPRVVNDD